MITPEAIFGLIMGFLIAWFFEKYYIGRFSVLPNVAGIFFLLQPYWLFIPTFVKWWTYVGIVLGIIALLFLFKKKELPKFVYDLTYPFYSGKTVMGIYTPLVLFKEFFPTNLFTIMFWIITGAFIIGVWFIGVKYL